VSNEGEGVREEGTINVAPSPAVYRAACRCGKAYHLWFELDGTVEVKCVDCSSAPPPASDEGALRDALNKIIEWKGTCVDQVAGTPNPREIAIAALSPPEPTCSKCEEAYKSFPTLTRTVDGVSESHPADRIVALQEIEITTLKARISELEGEQNGYKATVKELSRQLEKYRPKEKE